MKIPSADWIIHLHDLILDLGDGEPGILNRGTLEGCVARARYGPFGHRGDIFERAAILIRGIAQDHPFVDGSKRTAFATADVFLRFNGWEIDANDDVAVSFMLDVAQGKHDLAGIRKWLHANARKL